MERASRIEEIYQMIMELASGNLKARLKPTADFDELDAIAIGINMLAEELQSTTVSKNYLNLIYNSVVDILVIVTPDFVIKEVNPAACSILGYEESDLIGKTFYTVFAKNERRHHEKIREALANKGNFTHVERTFKTSKGKLFPVSLSGSVLYNDDANENLGILFIAKDISRLKKTDEQLRVRNEELNTFIYRASHDLRGPLASIAGVIDLARMEVQDAGSFENIVGLIEKSAQRLNTIVNELLILGRITQSVDKPTSINLNKLVMDTVKSFENWPEYTKVNISVQVASPYHFRSKQFILRTILHNLIENAIRYNRYDISKPSINIDLHQKNGILKIKVVDTGLGIKKEIQNKIFKMFYRGNALSTGSGLGLYLVSKGVEMLHGKMDVRSKELEGTSVTIYLPAAV